MTSREAEEIEMWWCLDPNCQNQELSHNSSIEAAAAAIEAATLAGATSSSSSSSSSSSAEGGDRCSGRKRKAKVLFSPS
jgi:hypothetical protein